MAADLLAQRRSDKALVLVLGAVGAVPLWWLQGVDAPLHQASVEVLARLWGGDAGIARNYEAVLQPIPYHLFYLCAVPLARLVGAFVASKLVLTAAYALHLAACGAAGEPILALVGIPLFYGFCFLWGFFPSLCGVACTLACIGCLTQPPKRMLFARGGRAGGLGHWGWPTLWSGLAVLAHIVFLPSCIFAALCATLCYGPRTRGRSTGAALAALVVAAPGLWQLLRLMPLAPGVGREHAVTFVSLLEGFAMLGETFGCYGRGAWFYGHVGLWLVLGLLILTAGARAWWTPRRGLLLLLLLGHMAFVWAIPVKTRTAAGYSWMLNLRFVTVVVYLAALLATESALWRGIWRPWVRATLVGCTVATLVGTFAAASAYRAATAGWMQAAASMTPHGRLVTMSQEAFVGAMVPPMRHHMASFAFVGSRLDWSNELFLGEHQPIRSRKPAIDETTSRMGGVFADGLRNAIGNCAALQKRTSRPPLWLSADSLFLQAKNIETWCAPSAAQAQLRASGEGWRLYGPPAPEDVVPAVQQSAGPSSPQ